MRRSFQTAALLILAIAICGTGQVLTTTTKTPPPFASVPPIESIDLYYSFFNYHQNLITTMTAAKLAAPLKSASIDQRAAALLGVDLKELPTVVASTQQVTQQFAKLASDVKTGSVSLGLPQGAPALTPSRQAAAAEFLRVRLTTEAVTTLFRTLSPASWKGLHSYIVGPYRSTIFNSPALAASK